MRILPLRPCRCPKLGYLLEANRLRDTSANTIIGFIKVRQLLVDNRASTNQCKQAMVLFPHVQAKAQEELDRVVGMDRLPIWEDRANLPYIRGVVEETLRCESNRN